MGVLLKKNISALYPGGYPRPLGLFQLPPAVLRQKTHGKGFFASCQQVKLLFYANVTAEKSLPAYKEAHKMGLFLCHFLCQFLCQFDPKKGLFNAL